MEKKSSTSNYNSGPPNVNSRQDQYYLTAYHGSEAVNVTLPGQQHRWQQCQNHMSTQQVQRDWNAQNTSFTNHSNRGPNPRLVQNNSFAATGGFGNKGHPNARRSGFSNGYNRRSFNAKGFDNSKYRDDANRSFQPNHSNRYNPNTRDRPILNHNVMDLNENDDLDYCICDSSVKGTVHDNKDGTYAFFPSISSSNFTNGQKVFQNFQKSVGQSIGASQVNLSLIGLQDEKLPQDASVLAVGTLSTSSHNSSGTSSEESSPFTPPKLTAKPKGRVPPGWKSTCPVTFKKVVDHNKDKNHVGWYLPRGAICKVMPWVYITNGLAVFMHRNGKHIFMPPEFCFDLLPFVETGIDEIPEGLYEYLADPKNDEVGRYNQELLKKHPELLKPPQVSNQPMTGWEYLKTVVDDIALCTQKCLLSMNPVSMELLSKKVSQLQNTMSGFAMQPFNSGIPSVQSCETNTESSSAQDVRQEKSSWDILPPSTRKFVLPPVSKGRKRSPPQSVLNPADNWLNKATSDSQKSVQLDAAVDRAKQETPSQSTRTVIFNPLQTSTPRKDSFGGHVSSSSRFVGGLQETPKSRDYKKDGTFRYRRTTIVLDVFDDAEIQCANIMTPQSKMPLGFDSSEETESPQSPST